MTTETQILQEPVEAARKAKPESSLLRVVKYTSVRLVMLFITVVVGVFLTIMIANMGGYVDRIRRGDIREAVGLRMQSDPAFRSLSEEARNKRIQELIALEEERVGLNQPFLIRTVRYLGNALMLNLGRAVNMSSDSGSRQVRFIILERRHPPCSYLARLIYCSSSWRYLSPWLCRVNGSMWIRFCYFSTILLLPPVGSMASSRS
jgi:hypothetical protein